MRGEGKDIYINTYIYTHTQIHPPTPTHIPQRPPTTTTTHTTIAMEPPTTTRHNDPHPDPHTYQVADMATYSFEQAKSGRASCKGCKQLIAKGDWRFGSHKVDFGVSWKHVSCVTLKQLANVTVAVGSMAEVDGYPEDEDEIKVMEELLASIPEKEKERDAQKAKERALKKAERDAEKAKIKAEGGEPKKTPKKEKVVKDEAGPAKSTAEAPPSKPLSKEEMKALRKAKSLELWKTCVEKELRLPSDELDAKLEVGTAMQVYFKDGIYDLEKTFDHLLEKFGSRNKGVKRAGELKAEQDGSAKKKKKKSAPEAVVEENQGLVECFWELSSFAFKEDNVFSGTSNIKIAKALMMSVRN